MPHFEFRFGALSGIAPSGGVAASLCKYLMYGFSSPRPALIVVDVQRAFDEWKAAGQRRNNPDAVSRILELLTASRSAYDPIFHIRHQGTQPGSSILPERSGFLVRDEAREREGELVIVKQVNSSFIGTDLERRLRTAGLQTLVICGATTNYCVETTARMAGNLGFDARLVRDATWTFDHVGPDGDRHSAEEIHAMTLANLRGEFARIVSTHDVIETLAFSRGWVLGTRQPSRLADYLYAADTSHG